MDKLTKLDAAIVWFCQVNLQIQNIREVLNIVKELSIREEKKSPIVIKRGVLCSVPEPPYFTVGLDVPLKELKTQLLKVNKPQILVTAPAGCSKTTLVEMLCQDNQIQGI